MEEINRAKYMVTGVELPCSLLGGHPPSTSMCSPTWKLPEPFWLRFFYGGFIIQTFWIKSLAIRDSTALFQPSNHLVGFSGNQFPSSKSHLISTNADIVERGLF